VLLLAVQRQARSSLPNIFQSTELASVGVQNSSLRMAVPVAGPSKSIGNGARTTLENQSSIITRLVGGEGINMLEWDGVIETCGNCQKTFLGAYFSGHLQGKACWAD
jgi:hypothetical protein